MIEAPDKVEVRLKDVLAAVLTNQAMIMKALVSYPGLPLSDELCKDLATAGHSSATLAGELFRSRGGPLR